MNYLVIILIAPAILILLYLMMIMPALSGKDKIRAFRQTLYAHRGLHDNATDAPENSMRAFEKAVAAGFGIELDIQLSKDQVPVVFHDFTLKRVCGAEGLVADYTYEELQQFSLCGTDQKIPKLEDVLALIDGRVPCIVELKTESGDIRICSAGDALLSKYHGPYCIESFNPLAVLWYRRHRKEVVRGQLSDGFFSENEKFRTPLHFCLQHLLLNFLGKPHFVAYNHKYPNALSRKLCKVLYRNTAAAWTIRSHEELERAKPQFDLYIFDSFVPETAKR
jgi:glycerophosphoryl diester phosphodiesterase